MEDLLAGKVVHAEIDEQIGEYASDFMKLTELNIRLFTKVQDQKENSVQRKVMVK